MLGTVQVIFSSYINKSRFKVAHIDTRPKAKVEEKRVVGSQKFIARLDNPSAVHSELLSSNVR